MGMGSQGRNRTPLASARECGADTPSHFVFSNADASTSLSRLARMHGCRFFIEHAFREAKSELAMADYQVRRWDAWHRHMALVMVAMLFLLKERLALQVEAPMLSLADFKRVFDLVKDFGTSESPKSTRSSTTH